MVTRTRLLLVMLIGFWSLQVRAQEPVTIGVMDFTVTKAACPTCCAWCRG